MSKTLYPTVQDEIRALKRERNAVILAHNYQSLEIQDLADHVGDSLHLARVAAGLSEPVVLFSGVHFMAETVKILSPDKTVIVPDLEAQCSLASMVRPEDIRAWREKYPRGIVVSYVNTPADVKAESDYCCTSSNAVNVVRSLPLDRDILFVPDFFLGYYVQQMTGRRLHLWNGFCHVHDRITPQNIEEAKRTHPGAELLMHPECGCVTKSMHLADKILSTGGMVEYAGRSDAKEFLVATETGLVDQLNQRYPGKKFIAVGNQATCEYMKMNTLDRIVHSLEKLEYRVDVPDETARRARRAIERMISIPG